MWKHCTCFVLLMMSMVMIQDGAAQAAQDITKPGDTVIGVPNDGDWPAVETPPLAIDDNIYTKYLHFKGDFYPYAGPTGLRVTPSVGPTVVTGLTFTTANDAPGRDPTVFELSGSNTSINGPYTLIVEGPISDFAGPIPWPRLTKTVRPINFENSAAYKHYQLLFPAIRGPVGGEVNSMQIAEVELLAGSGKATAPNPPDGATGVINPLLTWTKGGTAVWHNVYVGTSPNLTRADLKASQQSETMYWYPPGFQPGITYYWRVDEMAADGTIYTGDTWRFSALGKTAYDPAPANGAIAVDLNPVLTWKPGGGATRHQVFFGKSFQAVEAGTGDVKKSSTTTPLYRPGTLDMKTTYYWRVDEYDGRQTFKGEVWSFTTKGRPGGLKGQYYGDLDLGSLMLTRIDPDINFWWGLSSPDPRMSADTFSVRWTGEVEIPFSEPYTFITRTDDGVRLYVNNRLVINNWTDHSLTDNWSEPLPLVAGQTYPIKMEFYENQVDALAILEWQSPSTSRQVVPSDLLSPPYRASNPRPANLSTVSKKAKVTLSWSRGEKATEHDIYFGAAQQEVRHADTADATGIYRGRQTDTSYPLPDPLQSNQTYYWRIDEWNIDDTVSEGSVWSFTVSDSVNGDDFETNDFSKLPWRRGGNDWTITASESHSGTYSARAGLIGDDESSTLVLTQDVQEGIVTFWCKVSCERGSDRLEFSLDGIKKGEWAGELDWQAVSFPVNAGVRTFTWTYLKDISSSWGEDTAWIDDMVLP